MKAISHPTTLAGLTVLAALGVVPAHAAFKPSSSRTALFTHTSAHVAPMATPVRVSLHQQDGDHGAPVQVVAANAHGDTRDHGDSRDVRAATAVDRIAIGTVSGGSSAVTHPGASEDPVVARPNSIAGEPMAALSTASLPPAAAKQAMPPQPYGVLVRALADALRAVTASARSDDTSAPQVSPSTARLFKRHFGSEQYLAMSRTAPGRLALAAPALRHETDTAVLELGALKGEITEQGSPAVHSLRFELPLVQWRSEDEGAVIKRFTFESLSAAKPGHHGRDSLRLSADSYQSAELRINGLRLQATPAAPDGQMVRLLVQADLVTQGAVPLGALDGELLIEAAPGSAKAGAAIPLAHAVEHLFGSGAPHPIHIQVPRLSFSLDRETLVSSGRMAILPARATTGTTERSLHGIEADLDTRTSRAYIERGLRGMVQQQLETTGAPPTPAEIDELIGYLRPMLDRTLRRMGGLDARSGKVNVRLQVKGGQLLMNGKPFEGFEHD